MPFVEMLLWLIVLTVGFDLAASASAPRLAQISQTNVHKSYSHLYEERYLVKLRHGITLQHHLSRLKLPRDGPHIQEVADFTNFIDSYAANFSHRALQRLRADPDVISIRSDQPMRMQSIDIQLSDNESGLEPATGNMNTLSKRFLPRGPHLQAVSQRSAPWGLGIISSRSTAGLHGWNEYWYQETAGSGAYVFILNGGIKWRHKEFRTDGDDSGRIFELQEHGLSPYKPESINFNFGATAIAAVVGGHRSGVAKQATLVDVPISLGQRTTMEEHITALHKIIEFHQDSSANRPKRLIGTVVHISASSKEHLPSLWDAINKANRVGIAIVAAGPQSGKGREYPCLYAGVICVSRAGRQKVKKGLLTKNRLVLLDASTEANMLAPGEDMKVPDANSRSLSSYVTVNGGTPLAAAEVAGTMALFASIAAQMNLQDLVGGIAESPRLRALLRNNARVVEEDGNKTLMLNTGIQWREGEPLYKGDPPLYSTTPVTTEEQARQYEQDHYALNCDVSPQERVPKMAKRLMQDIGLFQKQKWCFDVHPLSYGHYQILGACVEELCPVLVVLDYYPHTAEAEHPGFPAQRPFDEASPVYGSEADAVSLADPSAEEQAVPQEEPPAYTPSDGGSDRGSQAPLDEDTGGAYAGSDPYLQDALAPVGAGIDCTAMQDPSSSRVANSIASDQNDLNNSPDFAGPPPSRPPPLPPVSSSVPSDRPDSPFDEPGASPSSSPPTTESVPQDQSSSDPYDPWSVAVSSSLLPPPALDAPLSPGAGCLLPNQPDDHMPPLSLVPTPQSFYERPDLSRAQSNAPEPEAPAPLLGDSIIYSGSASTGDNSASTRSSRSYERYQPLDIQFADPPTLAPFDDFLARPASQSGISGVSSVSSLSDQEFPYQILPSQASSDQGSSGLGSSPPTSQSSRWSPKSISSRVKGKLSRLGTALRLRPQPPEYVYRESGSPSNAPPRPINRLVRRQSIPQAPGTIDSSMCFDDGVGMYWAARLIYLRCSAGTAHGVTGWIELELYKGYKIRIGLQRRRIIEDHESNWRGQPADPDNMPAHDTPRPSFSAMTDSMEGRPPGYTPRESTETLVNSDGSIPAVQGIAQGAPTANDTGEGNATSHPLPVGAAESQASPDGVNDQGVANAAPVNALAATPSVPTSGSTPRARSSSGNEGPVWWSSSDRSSQSSGSR